jgi:hypothetical protein
MRPAEVILLRTLTDGPLTRAELKKAARMIDDRALKNTIRSGLVGSKNATLRSESGSGSAADEFYLTAKGAIVIGEDPDLFPWPFRG